MICKNLLFEKLPGVAPVLCLNLVLKQINHSIAVLYDNPTRFSHEYFCFISVYYSFKWCSLCIRDSGWCKCCHDLKLFKNLRNARTALQYFIIFFNKNLLRSNPFKMLKNYLKFLWMMIFLGLHCSVPFGLRVMDWFLLTILSDGTVCVFKSVWNTETSDTHLLPQFHLTKLRSLPLHPEQPYSTECALRYASCLWTRV